jgi:hypothetical protein
VGAADRRSGRLELRTAAAHSCRLTDRCKFQETDSNRGSIVYRQCTRMRGVSHVIRADLQVYQCGYAEVTLDARRTGMINRTMVLLLLDQIVVDSKQRQLESVRHAHFVVNLAQMMFDSVLADH